MNNEEKNPAPMGEENVENTKPATDNAAQPAKKLSGGLIGAIIGGVVALVALIVLLCTITPGGGDNTGGGNGGSADGPYTVTVVDQNGNPVAGVKLTYTTSKGIPFPNNKTDANGKFSFTLNENGVKIKVDSIPQGYEYSKVGVDQTFGNDRNLTITLTALEPIVIRVVDDEGNPVAGVLVQMCESSGSCRMPVTTDENGNAYYTYEDGEFKAQLTSGAPDGYSVDDPTAYYPIVDGEVTIVLNKN